MFARLGRFVVYKRWWVILAWVLAAIAVQFGPSLSDVTNSDQASFLPDKYESVQAQQLARDAFQQRNDASATIVVKRTDGGQLTDADQAKVGQLAQAVQGAGVPKVGTGVTGPQSVSPNKQVQLVTIELLGSPNDETLADSIKGIRDAVPPALAGSALSAKVTGDIAMFADNQEAFDTALLLIGVGAIVLIIVLLLLIYRSPIAALLPVVTVGIVVTISTQLVALVDKAFGLQADDALQIIITIVLYGVGTDYILFLLFRYRERLRAGDESKPALVTAVHRVGEVIASAAGAIIIAFMALVLASLGGFKSLGPGLAIAVAVMALAAVTLIPAVVSLLGPRVFWPSKSWRRTPSGSTYQRLGKLTGRRPGLVLALSGGFMVLLAIGALGFKVDFDQTAQLPATTESGQGFRDLQSGFPAGALNPTVVYLRSDSSARLDPAAVEQFAQQLKAVPGVGGIMPAGADGASAGFNQNGTVARINLLLAASPYANEALDLAGGELREVAHANAPPGSTALVGGTSSVFADVRSANNRDLKVIFPVAGLLIALILGLMLRSAVAPLYLLAAVVLGFFSTLGATVLALQGIGDRPGLSFNLPTILYLFVVAIGTDYNILMIARLREEAREGNDPRTAADLAVEHAGPSVGSAGLILAGTFGTLLIAQVAFLTEMGFSVSVGILISAFVMATFVVPSVTALLGHKAWWPGHGDAVAARPAPAPEPVLSGLSGVREGGGAPSQG